jgi:hypothetical protein
MNAQPRDYKVSPNGETARLLKEAAASRAPIRVDTGEAVYRVDAAETKRPYDPEGMIRAIYASAGALKDVDTDALLETLREERRQDSTGRPAE